MIKYGDIALKVEYGSLSIAKEKATTVHHYAGTDRSVVFDLGRKATRIACRLIAESENEKLLIEQLLQTITKRELRLGSFFYKDVVPDVDVNLEPVRRLQKGEWYIDARFVALDPVPYNYETGEAYY